MCNAWNHSPSCTCGWGGMGHSGKRAASSFGDHWAPPINLSYESYTNPNALCPVCNSPVFFYISPNGGRVFFDELGPPWSKHPCTDTESVPKRFRVSRDNRQPRDFGWVKDGWHPVEIRNDIPVDKGIRKCRVIWRDEEIDLYLATSSLVRRGRTIKIVVGTLAHLRDMQNDGVYELSFLDEALESIKIPCFKSLAKARDFEPLMPPRKAKSDKPPVSRKFRFRRKTRKRRSKK